jgi:hypothetical protein
MLAMFPIYHELLLAAWMAQARKPLGRNCAFVPGTTTSYVAFAADGEFRETLLFEPFAARSHVPQCSATFADMTATLGVAGKSQKFIGIPRWV